MISLTGFYDGSTIVPLDSVDLEKNQKVIITVLDDFIDSQDMKKKSKKSHYGALKNIITSIADDFDETPDCFKEYM